MPMPKEDDNISDNFGTYEAEISIPEAQDMERTSRNSVDKSSDTESRVRAEHTSEDGLLGSESSSSLREVSLSE